MSLYRSFDDRPYDSHYLHAEATIDRPVEAVWPSALDIGSWMSDYRLETIAGEPGKAGFLQRVHPPGIGETVPQPHYHLYGIAHIIPLKLIVLEVFPEKGGSYGKAEEKLSFDSIVLNDIGNVTTINMVVVDAMMGSRRKDSLKDLQSKEVATRERLLSYFDNLRRLVERGR